MEREDITKRVVDKGLYNYEWGERCGSPLCHVPSNDFSSKEELKFRDPEDAEESTVWTQDPWGARDGHPGLEKH